MTGYANFMGMFARWLISRDPTPSSKLSLMRDMGHIR